MKLKRRQNKFYTFDLFVDIDVLGLDPALPMITDSVRLSWRDARIVHTIQTNAGYYGDMGAIGHLDICVNSGLTQPFCANTERK